MVLITSRRRDKANSIVDRVPRKFELLSLKIYEDFVRRRKFVDKFKTSRERTG